MRLWIIDSLKIQYPRARQRFWPCSLEYLFIFLQQGFHLNPISKVKYLIIPEFMIIPQSFTKYLIVLLWNSALQEKFNFSYANFFASIKIFILAGRPGIMVSFCEVLRFSYFLIFDFMVKHQKVSKFYENDCLQNFLLLFMSFY